MGSKRFSFLFRSIAAGLVVTTLTLALGEHATALAAPQMAPAVAGLPKLSLPASLGRVEEFHHGTSTKTLFYIQDAHDSLEAQRNIARMVAYLVERQGVSTVYEEGYEGEVPTGKYFDEIRDPEVRRKTAFFFMDKLRIGGAEYAHIIRPRFSPLPQGEGRVRGDFKLIGADNIQKHLENIDGYRRTFETRRRTGHDLAALQNEIQGLADRHFPKEVKDWMKLRKRFDGGAIALIDYLKRVSSLTLAGTTNSVGAIHELPLRSNLSEAGSDFSQRYPYIRLILDAEHTQDKRVMREVENLNPVLLFGEIRRLEDDLFAAALSGARDRRTFGFYRDLEMIRRLSTLEVSSDEYVAAKEFLSKVKTADIAGFIVKTTGRPAIFSNRWEENLKAAARFYETAHARDEAIRGRLAEFVQDSHERSAALVFGGFHKNSIRAMLKEAGISYAIITPAMNGAPEAKHKQYYRDLMSSGRHAFEIPESVRRGAAAERLWEQAYKNAGAEAAVRSEIRVVAEVIRKKGAGAETVAIDRAAKSALQTQARSKRRGYHGGKTPSAIPGLLELHKAEVRGKTRAEAARIIEIAAPWFNQYVLPGSKLYKKYKLIHGWRKGRPSKVPALLEKFKKAIDGLTLYDAAIVMSMNRAILIKYAEAHPKILAEYNLNPRTRAEKTTQDLLAEKARRVYGKNLTEVARIIERDLSTVSRYFDKYPGDLVVFGIEKNVAHGKVGRPREKKSGKLPARARSEMRSGENIDEAVSRTGLDPLEDWQIKLVLEADQLRNASKVHLDRQNSKLLVRLAGLGVVFYLGMQFGGRLALLFKSGAVLLTMVDLLYHSLQVAMKIHQAGWRFGKLLFLGKAPQHEFQPSGWTWKRIIQTALVFNVSALLLTVGLVIVRFAGRLPQGNPWLEYLLAISLVLTLTQAQFIRLVYADINEWNQTPGTIWKNIVHAENAVREFSRAGLLPEEKELAGFDNQFTYLDGQVRTRNPNFPGPDNHSFYVLAEETSGLAVYRVQDEAWFQMMHHRELTERETFLYEAAGVLEGSIPYLIHGRQTQKNIEVSDGTVYSIYKLDLPLKLLARLRSEYRAPTLSLPRETGEGREGEASTPARAEMRTDAPGKEWRVKMDDKYRFYLPAALKAWREKFAGGIKVWPVQDQPVLRIYPLSGWQAFWERFKAQGQSLQFLERRRKKRIFLARTGTAKIDGQGRIGLETDFVNVTKLNNAPFIKPGQWILIERKDHLELRLSTAKSEMRRERIPGIHSVGNGLKPFPTNAVRSEMRRTWKSGTTRVSPEARSEMRVNLASVDAMRRRLMREMTAIESSTEAVDGVRRAFAKIFSSDAALSESLFNFPHDPEERAGYQAVMRLQLHDLARAIFFGAYEEAKAADKTRYALNFPVFLDRFLAAFSARLSGKLPAAANQALLEIQTMFGLSEEVRQRIASETFEKARLLAVHFRGDQRDIPRLAFEAGFDPMSDAVGHFSAAVRRYALEYGTPETLVAFRQFELEYLRQLQAVKEQDDEMRRLPKPPRLTFDEEAIRADLRSAVDRFFGHVSARDMDWILSDALESAESQIVLYDAIGDDEPERPWILQLEREARAAVFAAVQAAASEVFTAGPSTLSFSDGDAVVKSLFTSLDQRVKKMKPRALYNAYSPQLQKAPALARRWKQDRTEISSYIRDYLKVLTLEIEYHLSPSEYRGRTALGQDWFRHLRFRSEFHRLLAEATRRWMNERPSLDVDHAVHAFLYEWLTGTKGEAPLPEAPKILPFPKRSEMRKKIDDGTSIVKHAWPKTMMALAGGLLGIGAALSAVSMLYGFWRYFQNDPEGVTLGFYHYPFQFMLGSALIALPLMAAAFILDRWISLWKNLRHWLLVQRNAALEQQINSPEPEPNRTGVDLSKPALDEDASVPGNVEILDFPKLFEQVISPEGFELEYDGQKIILSHDGGQFLKVSVPGQNMELTLAAPDAARDRSSTLELAVNWEMLGGPDERWMVMLRWDPAANQMVFNRVMVIKQPGAMELEKMGSAEKPRAFVLFAPEQQPGEILEFTKGFAADSDFSKKFMDFLRWWEQMRYLRGPVRGLVREILSPQFLQLDFVSGEQLVIRPVLRGGDDTRPTAVRTDPSLVPHKGVMDMTWVPPHLEKRSQVSFALEWLNLNHFRFLLFNEQGRETLRAEPLVTSQYGRHDLPIHLSFSEGRFGINLPANAETVDAALPPLAMKRILQANGVDFSSRIRFSGRGFSRSEVRQALTEPATRRSAPPARAEMRRERSPSIHSVGNGFKPFLTGAARSEMRSATKKDSSKEDPWELAGEVSERAYRLHGLVSRMEDLPNWMLYSLALTANLISDRYDVLEEKRPDFNPAVYRNSLSAQQSRVQREYNQLVREIERRDEKILAFLNFFLPAVGGVLALLTPYVGAALFIGLIFLGSHISFPIRRWFKIQNAPLPRFMLPALTGANDSDAELKVLEEPVAKLVSLQPELYRKPTREVLSLIHAARSIEARLAAILMEQIEYGKKGESFANYDRLRSVTVQFRHSAENVLDLRRRWIGTALSIVLGFAVFKMLQHALGWGSALSGAVTAFIVARLYDMIVREIILGSPLPGFILKLIPLKYRPVPRAIQKAVAPSGVEHLYMKHVRTMGPKLLVKTLFGMAGRKQLLSPHTSFLIDVVNAANASVYMGYGPHGTMVFYKQEAPYVEILNHKITKPWVVGVTRLVQTALNAGLAQLARLLKWPRSRLWRFYWVRQVTFEDAEIKEARALYFRGHFKLEKNPVTRLPAPIVAFKPPYLFEEEYSEAKGLISRRDLEEGLYEDLRHTVQFLLDGGLSPETPFLLEEFDRVTNIREELSQHLAKDEKTDTYETTLGKFLEIMPPLLNTAKSEMRNFERLAVGALQAGGHTPLPKWQGKLPSPVMVYPAGGVDVATVAAFLQKFPGLNKVVLVDRGYGGLSGTDYRTEIARRLRQAGFSITTRELERLMRGNFDESGRLAVQARVPRKGLGPIRGIGRKIELVFYAVDYLEWKRGTESNEPMGLTVIKRPGLGGMLGHVTQGGEMFYERALSQAAPLGLIYLQDSMTPPAHFFKEERLETLETGFEIEAKFKELSMGLTEPFHLLDDYALLRKNHFKDLAEFNWAWKTFNFSDVDFGFVGHDVVNVVRILNHQHRSPYWTFLGRFHWWGHWAAALFFLDGLHFLIAGILSLLSLVPFVFKSVRESFVSFREDFRFTQASSSMDRDRSSFGLSDPAEFVMRWLFKKLDSEDARYWEYAYRVILAASLNLPGLREGLKFRREALAAKISPDLLRLLDEENPRVVENALFALIQQDNLQRLFAKQAAVSAAAVSLLLPRETGEGSLPAVAGEGEQSTDSSARSEQDATPTELPPGQSLPPARAEMRTANDDKPKPLGLVTYYDPSLFTSDAEYFQGRTSMPDALAAAGIQTADYGTVIYPASGNRDSRLLAILKQHIFPGIREYHLDDAGYSPKFAAHDSLAGRKVTAGELVLKNLKESIRRFSQDKVSIHVYHTDYYQTGFALKFAPGKRIWIDKGPGRDAKLRLDPEFYLSTLRRGLVRPGDLVLAVPYAGTEIGQYWHKKITEGVYVPAYRDWTNWTVFEVTAEDFTAVGLPVPKPARSEMRAHGNSYVGAYGHTPLPAAGKSERRDDSPVVQAKSSLENLHGKYVIATDIATFNALTLEEQSEYYRLFEAYRESGEVKFVFNAASADEKMNIPETLAFFDKRYDNVLINRMPAARLSFNDEGRRVITVSQQGIMPVFSRFVETSRAEAGKLLRVQYQVARSAQGLLSAALLTFELGEPLLFSRVMTDVPALWRNAVTDFLAAYQVFGISA